MTALPAAPPISVETILKDSWSLLRRNWVLVVPMIGTFAAVLAVFAIAIAAVALSGALPAARHLGEGVIATLVVIALLIVIGSVVIGAAVTAMTFGMADSAWTTGRATWSAGFAAMRTRVGATLAAFVALMGLMIVALFFALPTLGLALLAFPVVTMYVLPAVVSGGRGGFVAVRESFLLVRHNFATSAIAALILYALQYLISLCAYVVILPIQVGMSLSGGGQGTPSIAALAGFGIALALAMLVLVVALYAYQAFYTLAIVGVYRGLRGRAA